MFNRNFKNFILFVTSPSFKLLLSKESLYYLLFYVISQWAFSIFPFSWENLNWVCEPNSFYYKKLLLLTSRCLFSLVSISEGCLLVINKYASPFRCLFIVYWRRRLKTYLCDVYIIFQDKCSVWGRLLTFLDFGKARVRFFHCLPLFSRV